jgi:hypothetical protein
MPSQDWIERINAENTLFKVIHNRAENSALTRKAMESYLKDKDGPSDYDDTDDSSIKRFN